MSVTTVGSRQQAVGSRQQAVGSRQLAVGSRQPIRDWAYAPKSPNPQIPKSLHGTYSARRGVLLLIVLAVLALFALIAVTFVILAGHERRAAEAQARVEQYADPPNELLNEAFLQVLRGSGNAGSVLRHHNLLEDVYGNDGISGTVVANSSTPNVPVKIAGGQIIEFAAQTPDNEDLSKYIGCVLTLQHGPASGQSTRIVGYDSSTGRIQIVTLEPGLYGEDGQPGIAGNDDDHNLPVDDWKETGVVGSDDLLTHGGQFIINGSPFSGTGFGYDQAAAISTPTDPQLTLTFTDPISNKEYPYALAPNLVNLPNGDSTNPDDSIYEATIGGANEDYDAWDFQNMLLAAQLPEELSFSFGDVPAGTTPIPSLHRPALVNYWFHLLNANPPAWFSWPTNATTEADKLQAFLAPYGPTYKRQEDPSTWTWNWSDISVADNLVALKRRIIMRPLREDNPNFTGGNPYFNPLWNGYEPLDLDGDGVNDRRWDVDNDGDGIADSIWVDIGFPVRSTADGRMYVPLVAILCTDLGGRLDINAHGSLAQTETAYDSPTDLGSLMIPTSGTPISSLAVPRGQGTGPAEVNLAAISALTKNHPDDSSRTQYDVLLKGIDGVVGRYGPVNASGSTSPLPGVDLWAEPLTLNKFFDLPDTYDPTGSATTAFLSYGSPLDLHGTMQIGLDLRGQPVYASMVTSQTDNPYELDLFNTSRGSASASDAPFTPAELEALLRMHDVDASSLPDRINVLAPWLLPHYDEHNNWVKRSWDREITTDSWDLPTPAVSLPPELRSKTNVAAWLPTLKAEHVVDLIRAKLVAENSNLDDSNDPSDVATLQKMVAALCPVEILAGLRMDLNRPLGNGRDGNDNRVIDEPYESDTNFPQVNASGGSASTNTLDPDNDGSVGVSHYASERQLYARHLYVLMLALMDYEVATPGSPSDEEKAIARRAAQWAMNVVDFRDRDAIMTPFEYDIEPFTDEDHDGNPWDVNGLLGAYDAGASAPDDDENYRGLVWGCERPELLITETLAFHDRRTEDTALDPTTRRTVDFPPDEDFDQKRRPQGSLFVELYNPSTDNEPKPGEFYESTYGGIDLSRTASDGTPVWRLAIVRDENDLDKDPDAPKASEQPVLHGAAYFVGSSAAFPPDVTSPYYRADTTNPIAPIMPGRYVVIGPDDEIPDDGKSITCMGACPSDPTNPGNVRRIELQPLPNPTVADQQVKVYADGVNDQLSALEIQNPTAIILGGPGRLSISEPTDGYPTIDPTGVPYDPTTGTYTTPWDRPQDNPEGGTTEQQEFWTSHLSKNGVHPRTAVVHLQRLANPLLPYDEKANPYRTVDSMPVDLTTFNGKEKGTASSDEGESSSHGDSFYSRERGEEEEGNTDSTNQLWPQILASTASQNPSTQDSVPIDTTGGAVSHVYNEPFACTLGYLNEGYQPAWSSADETDPSSPQLQSYYGSPKTKPFPWLTWLNRPLASEAELMLVPKTQSSQLLLGNIGAYDKPEFTLADRNGGNSADETYSNDNTNAPFRHLLNFFQNGDDTANSEPDMKLGRLLEFVRVPSRFTGTELQGNPLAFAENTSSPTHSFHPPFNRISNYREPGRTNLNTIASPHVLQGLINSLTMPATNATWDNLVRSRRADNTNLTATLPAERMFELDGTYPTRFENPFRSFAGVYTVPNEDLQKAIDPHYTPGTNEPAEINTTLLRPAPNGSGGLTNEPLFNFESDQPVNDTDRSPVFRYQMLNRLSNVVTGRSNVYAVWITVGYFEVEPWRPVQQIGGDWVNDQDLTKDQFLAIHPDGYRLGAELDSETGQIKRHRGFSIIDRSIPVGFQRGKDNNVEKAILLKRFIE